MKTVGIYQITNEITGQVYIGLSKDCKARLSKHKGELQKNRHKNTHLQNSWNKYGETNFSFDVILLCGPEELSALEVQTISARQSHLPQYGFNNSLGGENNPPTDATRKKLSEVCKRRLPPSEETRKKLSSANKGRKLSEEHKEKIKKANTGRKQSEEQKAKIAAKMVGNTHGAGHARSEEAKTKIGAANKGNKAGAGRKMSEAHYAAFVEANKGKPRSEETRAKMSATMKLRYGKKSTSE